MLRIAPQQGLQCHQQSPHTDSRTVRLAEDFQGLRMVVSGRYALVIKGKLAECKERGGDTLIELRGRQDV